MPQVILLYTLRNHMSTWQASTTYSLGKHTHTQGRRQPHTAEDDGPVLTVLFTMPGWMIPCRRTDTRTALFFSVSASNLASHTDATDAKKHIALEGIKSADAVV